VTCPPSLGLAGVAALDPSGSESSLDLPALVAPLGVVDGPSWRSTTSRLALGSFGISMAFLDLTKP
jgi:hypothetical protein